MTRRSVQDQEPTIHARPAHLSDSEIVFSWRNDPVSRQMFHDTEAVVWSTHQTWFEKALAQDDRHLFICEISEHKRVAIVRFDIEKKDAVVSINMAPEARGRGLARHCLWQSILHFKENASRVTHLIAEIKKSNTPSRKAFEAVGFALDREIEGVWTFGMRLPDG